MKLSVNIIIFSANPDMSKYETKPEDRSKFDRSLDFKDYISVSEKRPLL